MSHTDAAKETKRGSFGYSDMFLYKFMFSYVKKYMREVVIILISMGLNALLTASGPLLLFVTIDILAYGMQPEGVLFGIIIDIIQSMDFIPLESKWKTATILSFLYLGLQIIIFVISRYQTLLIAELGLKAELEMRIDMFAHLQALDLSYHDRNEVGRIMSRLTSDLQAIRQMLGGQVIMNVSNMVSVIVVLVIVIRMDFVLSLVAIISIPVVVIVGGVARRYARPLRKETRRTNSILMANIGEAIAGIKVSKGMNREEENIEVFKELNLDNQKAAITADSMSAVFFPIYLFLSVLGTAFTVYIGGLRVIDGFITIGALVAFLNYNAILFRPVIQLGQFYQQLQDALTGAERVYALLDTKTKVPMNTNLPDLPYIQGEVEFIDLNFAYVENEWIYRNFNLKVNAGETVALVGRTGAGKSTIVNILSRMYEFQSGQLLIDGSDIRKYSLPSFRSQIATVPQDFFLFSTSIRDNLKLGNPMVSEEEMWGALDKVGLKEYISKMPLRLDTPLQERGGRLSVGQRQLLVLATVLIANPRILILDEASSSIDLFSEIKIQKAIKLLLEDRTAFIIAHRLTTIRDADNILVIDGGRIVESGKHEELLHQQGAYYQLVKNQLELSQVN
ncbi:MAG: ABC transporter ATP-binding protein [Candidatus Heimdallarchaeota archaeon]|nr:ABC transporter ATP-binding protein [Candidatus Heimdallarchaeota archaeon]